MKYLMICLFLFFVHPNKSMANNSQGVGTKGQPEGGEFTEHSLEINISCADLEDCPDYAGGLAYPVSEVIQRKMIYGVQGCSQTLIAPDQIITNRHCLPQDSVKVGASCDNITVVFPQTKQSPRESLACQTILEVSPLYPDPNRLETFPDWAILQLVHPVQRNPIEVDTSGVPHKTTLKTFPVYYEYAKTKNIEVETNSIKTVASGNIKKTSCRSYMDLFSSYYYNHPHSPLLNFICDSDTIYGNSGAGLISREGKISGVGSMIHPTNFTPFMGARRNLPLYKRTITGSNVHCIHPLNTDRSAACGFDATSVQMYSIGFFASITHGKTPSEAVLRELEAAIAKDKTIQWEDHNEIFVSQIYALENTFQGEPLLPSSSAILDYVKPIDLQKSFPKTPLCIHSSRKEKSFHLMLPRLSFPWAKLNISKKEGRFLSPLELSFLQFEMEYDAINDRFSGQLSLMGVDMKNRFDELMIQIVRGFYNCLYSPFEAYCRELHYATEQIENLKSSSVTTANLFTNEHFIADNPKGTNKITIPVCGN